MLGRLSLLFAPIHGRRVQNTRTNIPLLGTPPELAHRPPLARSPPAWAGRGEPESVDSSRI
jgi:hypothetical protein